MATAIEGNKQLVRRVNDGLNDQSREAFVDLHTEDVVIHDGGEEIRGIDAAVAHEEAIWHGFPDLHHTMEDVLAEGDRVAYRFTAAGTHDGTFHGIEPTGRTVEITGLGIARVAGDEIAEVWLNYDALGLMRQLGVVGSPEPPRK